MRNELETILDKMYETKTNEKFEIIVTANIKKDIEKLNQLSKVLEVVGAQKIAELYKKAKK